MARFNALRDALEDDTVSDEALDFVADPYADPTTRLLRSGRASPEVEAFLAQQNEIQDRRDAERAVKTASRLPPVKAQEDVTIGAPTPRLPPVIPGEFDFVERNPTAEVRADGQVYDSKTGARLAKSMREAVAQSDAPTPSFLRQTIVPDYVSPAGPVTGSIAPSVSGARPAKKDEYDLTEQEVQDEAKGFGITPEQMRAWLAQERSRKQQSASPASSAARPTPARRAAPSPEAQGPVPSFTLEDVPSGPIPSYTLEDVAQGPTPEASAKSARRNVSLTSPIPVANASTRTDAPAAAVSALPSTGPKTPAGTPNSAGMPDLPAPSSEGAGGDSSERDLYLARLAAQNAAGFGGMGAGKNIDMGIADTLGERLKQVQALRAKREEQSLEQQRERATWGTSNRATLASALAQWKGDEAKTAALEALADGADATKPSDFSRNVVNAVMTKPKVLGAEAAVTKTEATTDLTNARVPEVKLEGESKRALRQAQIDRLRRQTAANALSLTRSARAVETAGKGNVPSKEAIKYIRDDIKTAEKAITPTLENFKNIERAAPGFAFGKPDKSVATMDFVAAEKLPAFANKARDLRSAVEALIVDIRHGSFGASLTAPEKASFETMLNTGLTGTVEQLSRAINMVRQKAAATAQTHFNTSMTFYPTETSQVLSGSAVFGPATRDGGVYSDVWRVQAPPTAAGGRPEKPTLAAGKTALWDVAKGKWVSAPDAQVDAAVASGKYEK